MAKNLYISYYIFHKVVKCRGDMEEEEVGDLEVGMVMDGCHGQDGVEEIRIHSAGDFHGFLEDGGECHTCHTMDCHITHGGGGKCHSAWVHMAG